LKLHEQAAALSGKPRKIMRKKSVIAVNLATAAGIESFVFNLARSARFFSFAANVPQVPGRGHESFPEHKL
jgi:hypothetical protein